MAKSANEVMQEVISAAAIDAVMALKAASKGLPNNLLRDLNAIHQNTTFEDLPKEVQTAIAGSVRAAFTRLMREGYSVSPAGSSPPPPPRQPTFRRDERGPNRGPSRGPGNPPGPGGRPGPRRQPGKGPRPGGKPGGGRGR